MSQSNIPAGITLIDLISGKVPTYISWTVDPTDGADITDGDPTTVCTTGNAVLAAWADCYMEWDLGQDYDLQVSGVGCVSADAGNETSYLSMYVNGSWVSGGVSLMTGGSQRVYTSMGCRASKVRICAYSTADATLTPNIREFHVWRL